MMLSALWSSHTSQVGHSYLERKVEVLYVVEQAARDIAKAYPSYLSKSEGAMCLCQVHKVFFN